MLLDSQDVFFFSLSRLDNIISRIIISRHTHVRRMSLNSNQGKIIPSVRDHLKYCNYVPSIESMDELCYEIVKMFV